MVYHNVQYPACFFFYNMVINDLPQLLQFKSALFADVDDWQVFYQNF